MLSVSIFRRKVRPSCFFLVFYWGRNPGEYAKGQKTKKSPLLRFRMKRFLVRILGTEVVSPEKKDCVGTEILSLDKSPGVVQKQELGSEFRAGLAPVVDSDWR